MRQRISAYHCMPATLQFKEHVFYKDQPRRGQKLSELGVMDQRRDVGGEDVIVDEWRLMKRLLACWRSLIPMSIAKHTVAGR